MLPSRPSPSADPRAWTTATIDPSSAWYYPLAVPCLEALARVVEEHAPAPETPPLLPLPAAVRSACAACLAPAREALERGRGFAILTGLPPGRFTRPQQQALYWLVGQLLGQPFAQNVQGTLLYDVRDTGQDLAKGARFSVTSYETHFHTDNSFGDAILDYVGLLCLQTAKAGGLSQVISGHAVYHVLQAEHPDALRVLMEPFHVDRRGGVLAGQEPTARFPVIARRGDDLLFRYLRYWIHAGHDKAQQPLTSAQAEALDLLDEVMRRRELIVEFMLRPGEMFFINNRWILHNRTAFEDFPEPERRRHYVRLWLRAAG